MITIIRIDVEVEVILLKIKFTAMLLHEHINTILKKCLASEYQNQSNKIYNLKSEKQCFSFCVYEQ